MRSLKFYIIRATGEPVRDNSAATIFFCRYLKGRFLLARKSHVETVGFSKRKHRVASLLDAPRANNRFGPEDFFFARPVRVVCFTRNARKHRRLTAGSRGTRTGKTTLLSGLRVRLVPFSRGRFSTDATTRRDAPRRGRIIQYHDPRRARRVPHDIITSYAAATTDSYGHCVCVASGLGLSHVPSPTEFQRHRRRPSVKCSANRRVICHRHNYFRRGVAAGNPIALLFSPVTLFKATPRPARGVPVPVYAATGKPFSRENQLGLLFDDPRRGLGSR